MMQLLPSAARQGHCGPGAADFQPFLGPWCCHHQGLPRLAAGQAGSLGWGSWAMASIDSLDGPGLVGLAPWQFSPGNDAYAK